jgi:hypothetical protein
VMHQSRAGTLTPEEPDELIAHVRVCGGAGWVTTGSTRKSQDIDIAEVILSLIKRPKVVQTRRRKRKSRFELLSTSEAHRSTTKSDGMWIFLVLRMLPEGILLLVSKNKMDFRLRYQVSLT